MAAKTRIAVLALALAALAAGVFGCSTVSARGAHGARESKQVKLWPVFDARKEVHDNHVLYEGNALFIFSWHREKNLGVAEPVVAAETRATVEN